jgi:ornithine cyclodeaminase/alanine dehydrogenase-like protein (mu-crystallin family)
MLVLGADQIRAAVSMPNLIECIRAAFQEPVVAPERQVVKIPGGPGSRLFAAMPAFDLQGHGAVKLVTFNPGNRPKGLPTIQAVVVVFSDEGTPLALLEGTMVTRLRTGAASALASTYLSRAESSHLVLLGTGALAPFMALAHSTVRPIRKISVWGRSMDRAARTAAEIRVLIESNIEVHVTSSARDALVTADIACCATSSPDPILLGQWLQPGTFVDLVGSFSPSSREIDDEGVMRSRIFVDTFEGALVEGGDIVQPIARGLIERTHIEGQLADLVSGRTVGRRLPEEIVLFKSVGTPIEDLAAARFIVAAADRNSALGS